MPVGMGSDEDIADCLPVSFQQRRAHSQRGIADAVKYVEDLESPSIWRLVTSIVDAGITRLAGVTYRDPTFDRVDIYFERLAEHAFRREMYAGGPTVLRRVIILIAGRYADDLTLDGRGNGNEPVRRVTAAYELIQSGDARDIQCRRTCEARARRGLGPRRHMKSLFGLEEIDELGQKLEPRFLFE